MFCQHPCGDCFADVVDGFLFVFTLRDTTGKRGAFCHDPTIFCGRERYVKRHRKPLWVILTRTPPAGTGSGSLRSGGVIDDDLPAVVAACEEVSEDASCV